MSSTIHRLASLGGPCLAVFAFTACDPGPTSPPDPAASSAEPVVASAALGPEVSSWLAQLRGALAPHHRIEAAAEAGWDTPITGCMEQPGVGGMGYHYANLPLLDGTVEELAPEALLYEPQKNGRMRLVAVEYIVPFVAWTSPEPPVLHGQTFSANEAFQVWALHAWIFRENRSGMFADWNARVDCDDAP